ncbi:MAG: hypothetical protein IJR29_05445 [Butyrivibrio sp.]|nr:hypothetical protein [Butyrivibrio sp.]
MEYSSVYKNKLINALNEIERKVAKLPEFIWATEAYDYLVQEIQGDILSFSKDLAVLNGFFEVYSEPNIFLISMDDHVKKKILSSIHKIMSDSLLIMESLDKSLLSDDKQKIFQSVCNLFGEIALILRFDILSPPSESSDGASVLEICKHMDLLKKNNGDCYTLNKWWFCSERKFLPEIEISDTAIVVQGPIKREENFTIETLMYYRKIYPSVPIVLSTWIGEIDRDFKYLANSIGVIVLENEIPKDKGITNINLQKISSYNGIRKIEANDNIKFVLKTRTDQRFFLPDFLAYMRGLIMEYPSNGKAIENRIIFLGGYSSHCSYPFRLTDFMTFGNVADLILFYSNREDDERLKNAYSSEANSILMYKNVFDLTADDNVFEILKLNKSERLKIVKKIGKFRDPETSLAARFYEMEVLGRKFEDGDDELLHYWKFIKDYTIIIDPNQLMFYWYKYDNEYLTNNYLISDGGLSSSAWHMIRNYTFDE